MSRGRHRRRGLPARALAAGTSVVSGAAVSAALSGHAAMAAPLGQVPAHVPVPVAHEVRPAQERQAIPRYIVRPGDYLSLIASRKCGQAGDWTGIYAASRAVIGADPDMIYPGQRLVVRCAAVPVALRRPVIATTAVRVAGDSDGSAARPVVHHDPPPARGGTGSGSFLDPAGQLTRDEVGELWLEAGGPSWAEGQAEAVSYCESGWNTRAYNPSGASGLWQILGEVVPGDVFDAFVNAENAVAKFRASGDTWAQWVCQP